jgi:thiol-disulfide isomerase/thioredoxin
MVCPKCHLFTPDQGFKCINCGVEVPRKDLVADLAPGAPGRIGKPGFFRPWMLAVAGLLGVLGYLAVAHANRSQAVNAFNPGAEFSVEAHLQRGKTTIVDFYSEHCPPCRQISPLLKKLEKMRSDLAVVKVDIDRKGAGSIDWLSPLARQYDLQSVPYFRIYDQEGNLTKQGQEAYVAVLLMLAASGIRM